MRLVPGATSTSWSLIFSLGINTFGGGLDGPLRDLSPGFDCAGTARARRRVLSSFRDQGLELPFGGGLDGPPPRPPPGFDCAGVARARRRVLSSFWDQGLELPFGGGLDGPLRDLPQDSIARA